MNTNTNTVKRIFAYLCAAIVLGVAVVVWNWAVAIGAAIGNR